MKVTGAVTPPLRTSIILVTIHSGRVCCREGGNGNVTSLSTRRQQRKGHTMSGLYINSNYKYIKLFVCGTSLVKSAKKSSPFSIFPHYLAFLFLSYTEISLSLTLHSFRHQPFISFISSLSLFTFYSSTLTLHILHFSLFPFPLFSSPLTLSLTLHSFCHQPFISFLPFPFLFFFLPLLKPNGSTSLSRPHTCT